MPLAPSPQNVIDRFGHPVDWYAFSMGEMVDGYAGEPTFADPVTITASIHPGETAEFEITAAGQADARTLLMSTRTATGVTEDDHIRLGPEADPAALDVDDPNVGTDGKTGWRCTQPMYGTRYDIVRFVLIEDDRENTPP